MPTRVKNQVKVTIYMQGDMHDWLVRRTADRGLRSVSDATRQIIQGVRDYEKWQDQQNMVDADG